MFIILIGINGEMDGCPRYSLVTFRICGPVPFGFRLVPDSKWQYCDCDCSLQVIAAGMEKLQKVPTGAVAAAPAAAASGGGAAEAAKEEKKEEPEEEEDADMGFSLFD